MAVERTPAGGSLIDVLDRVLDKGIVVDAWVRVSLVGIDLITLEARIVVASIATYLQYSDIVEEMPTISGPTPALDGRATLIGRRLPIRPRPRPRISAPIAP
jgi:gas vesicle structural protein